MNAKRLTPAEMMELFNLYKEMRKSGIGPLEACTELAPKFNRQPETLYHLCRRLTESTDIAQQYIKANALRLATRVVRDADVAQSIDILSRPNINVLAPKQEAESSGGRGFFLSVQADSCGAVNINTGEVRHALQKSEADESRIRRLPGIRDEGQSEGVGGRNPGHQEPPADRPEKVEGRQRDESLQVADVQPENPLRYSKPPQIIDLHLETPLSAAKSFGQGKVSQGAILLARERIEKARLKRERKEKWRQVREARQREKERNGS